MRFVVCSSTIFFFFSPIDPNVFNRNNHLLPVKCQLNVCSRFVVFFVVWFLPSILSKIVLIVKITSTIPLDDD